MAELPQPQNSTRTLIFKQYEKSAEAGQRPHLGASELGHECERYLWLSFRWAKQPDFDGRMLRLFESGQLAEPRLIANLRAIGVEVSDRDEKGGQWRFSAVGGHVGGSMDGAALGLPEAPKTWHVLEFKTANAMMLFPLVWLVLLLYCGCRHRCDKRLPVQRQGIRQRIAVLCEIGRTFGGIHQPFPGSNPSRDFLVKSNV